MQILGGCSRTQRTAGFEEPARQLRKVLAGVLRDASMNPPANLDDYAVVAERTIRQRCGKLPHVAGIPVRLHIARNPLEVMNREVLVPFSFGVPKNRQFSGLHRLGLRSLDGIAAGDGVTGKIDAIRTIDANVDAGALHPSVPRCRRGCTTSG